LFLQNKIFAASQQAMQQGPRLQQMLVHNETTGQVMWDLSEIAQQNKARIENSSSKFTMEHQLPAGDIPLS
jgi:hypothetical protein